MKSVCPLESESLAWGHLLSPFPWGNPKQFSGFAIGRKIGTSTLTGEVIRRISNWGHQHLMSHTHPHTLHFAVSPKQWQQEGNQYTPKLVLRYPKRSCSHDQADKNERLCSLGHLYSSLHKQRSSRRAPNLWVELLVEFVCASALKQAQLWYQHRENSAAIKQSQLRSVDQLPWGSKTGLTFGPPLGVSTAYLGRACPSFQAPRHSAVSVIS